MIEKGQDRFMNESSKYSGTSWKCVFDTAVSFKSKSEWQYKRKSSDWTELGCSSWSPAPPCGQRNNAWTYLLHRKPERRTEDREHGEKVCYRYTGWGQVICIYNLLCVCIYIYIYIYNIYIYICIYSLLYIYNIYIYICMYMGTIYMYISKSVGDFQMEHLQVTQVVQKQHIRLLLKTDFFSLLIIISWFVTQCS